MYAIEHCQAGQADMDTSLRTQEQSETPEATQILLDRDRRRDTQTLLFKQRAVQRKMSSFHSKLMLLEFHYCSTCLECFPNLSMAAGCTECRHCNQDRHIPKLYSTANNMNPGIVPPQLQVSTSCIVSSFLFPGYAL